MRGKWTGHKGSLRDPFLYLGLFSVILFGILSAGASFIFKPFVQQGNFSFLATASEVLRQPSQPCLLAYQKGKIESSGLNLIQENSLVGISPPSAISSQVLGSLAGLSGDFQEETPPPLAGDSKEIIEYIVQPGDNLLAISEKFGISLETLLWANNLNKKSFLQPGQKLIILPVSGVLYYVKKGDTLDEIAKIYKGEVKEIISFNELSAEGAIYVGDILIIPHGKIPLPAKPVSSPPQTPLASSYFICPISPPCKITQGLHWPNAIDFSHGDCGEPIYAAAGGEVLRIKYGWNRGAGNNLTILHPNGVVTNYGHLQSILVKPGESVSQGQMIALMGGQPGTPGAGKSTGCHLHFGVSGARNPFAK